MEKSYEKSGCNNCKFYKSKWGWIDGKFTRVSQICESRFDEKMNQWWVENSDKKSGETTLMECHEWHDSTKSLIDMNRMTSEILTLLKNN